MAVPAVNITIEQGSDFASTYIFSQPGGGLTYTSTVVGTNTVVTFTAGTGYIQFI